MHILKVGKRAYVDVCAADNDDEVPTVKIDPV
jgi:hypothetical protein